MMAAPQQHFGQLARRRRFLVDLVVGDLASDPAGIQGRTLRLPTGQLATFARASAGSGVDAKGNSYDAPNHYPALSIAAGRAGIPLRPADSPRAVETLSIEYAGRIVPHTGYIRFVDRGAGATASARYLQWGNASTPRLIVLRGASGPTVNWDGGSGQQTSVSLGNATAGTLVQIWWRLTAAGTVSISHQYGASALAEAAASSAGDLPPSTPASLVMTVGGGPGDANAGGIDLEVLRIHPEDDASLGYMQVGSGLDPTEAHATLPPFDPDGLPIVGLVQVGDGIYEIAE